MNQTKQINSEVLWISLFTVIPVVFTMNYGDFITSDNGMKILYGSLFGGVSGLIGYTSYYLTKDKSSKVKIGILIILIIFSLSPILILNKSTETTNVSNSYLSCNACGYISYKEDEKSCHNCDLVLTNEELEKSGLKNSYELIKLEQIYYFMPEEGDSINFFEPKISEDGFKKDLNWKPIVTKDTIMAYSKSYYEFKKNNPVKIEIIKK